MSRVYAWDPLLEEYNFMKNQKMLGNGLLLLTAIVWGTAFVFQRVGMDYIEPFTFSFVRMYLASAALCVVAFLEDIAHIKKKGKRSVSMGPEGYARYKKDTILGGICCGICLSGGTCFQQFGVVYTTAGKAGFITALYMLLVPIIGVLFLKRKVQWLTWIGVVVGTIGLYLLSIKGGFTIDIGDRYVMVCAVFFSLHILCCDHFSGRGNPLQMSAVQFFTTAVVTNILAILFETPTWEKISSAWFPIVFCGLFSGALGYTLQMIAQKYTEPAVASLLMSLESVFAAISGRIILKETMSGRETLGCIIMFTAIILVQIPLPAPRKDKNKKQPA